MPCPYECKVKSARLKSRRPLQIQRQRRINVNGAQLKLVATSSKTTSATAARSWREGGARLLLRGWAGRGSLGNVGCVCLCGGGAGFLGLWRWENACGQSLGQ